MMSWRPVLVESLATHSSTPRITAVALTRTVAAAVVGAVAISMAPPAPSVAAHAGTPLQSVDARGADTRAIASQFGRRTRVIRVGPGRSLSTPSAAAAVARDGDTVEIDAGDYVADVATWTQHDLTLRSVGGKVRLSADGASAQGKAIWVVAGDRTVVRGIEFRDAVVPDGNGAGIRAEGTDLRVVQCTFRNNQDGILAGADPESDIVIKRSRFVDNGAGDGYTHNLYIGNVRSLRVTGSFFGGASVGHQIKSRARTTLIRANRIVDRATTASYSIDLPNGGPAVIAGNLIQQGARSENSALVSYGAEGWANPGRTLWVVNNTFVNDADKGVFVAVAPGARPRVWNNLIVGPGDLLSAPGQRRANRRVGRGGFVAPGRWDYRLTARSPAIDRGRKPPRRVRARSEYRHPQRVVARRTVGRVDLGSFERR